MHKLPLHQATLRSCCTRCEVRRLSVVREFHLSHAARAAENTPTPPSSRQQRSQASFRQISQLPQGSAVRTVGIKPSNPRTRSPQRSFTPRDNQSSSHSNRFSPARGQGAGRGRGGGAARRGGGSRAQGPPRRRGRGGASASDDGEEAYSPAHDPTNYDVMMEEDGDLYNSTDELKNYAQAVDLIDYYHELQAEVDANVKYGSDSGKRRMSAEQEEQARGEYDEVIKEAMDNLIEVDERELPRHYPQGSWNEAAGNGTTGNVPIGAAGMANLVEENLRTLADREAGEWQHPRVLAEKLASSQLVKFRHAPEKAQVLRFAEEMAYQPGQSVGTINVGFESPSEEAKKEIVVRTMSGQYQDPQDTSLNGAYVKQVARILNGNSTYPVASKSALLQTIQELMPEKAARR